jgi:hypothetical protein
LLNPTTLPPVPRFLPTGILPPVHNNFCQGATIEVIGFVKAAGYEGGDEVAGAPQSAGEAQVPSTPAGTDEDEGEDEGEDEDEGEGGDDADVPGAQCARVLVQALLSRFRLPAAAEEAWATPVHLRELLASSMTVPDHQPLLASVARLPPQLQASLAVCSSARPNAPHPRWPPLCC